MKYYSVPASFTRESIDKYAELNNKYDDSKVTETYGNITINNFFGSGRSHSQLPKIDLATLSEFIAYSKKHGIEFNYTLNASHLQNREFTERGVIEIKTFLHQLYDAGVRILTVSLPSVIDLVRATGLDFSIKGSAICSIDNVNIALAFKKMGVNKIVIKEMINRDFHILKRIRRAFGENVEIIVNSPCHIDCNFRMSHYNQQSYDSVEYTNEMSFNYYEHVCMLRRYRDIGNWLKIIWVRPEDIKYYVAIGINYFKLQGRQLIAKGGDPVRVTEAYFKESFDGNLVDLINMFSSINSFVIYLDNKKLDGFIKPFFEIENFCKRDCSTCTYCDDFSKKCINYEDAKKVSAMATKFYQEYDQFYRVIDQYETENKTIVTEKHEDDGLFDF